VRLAGLAEDQQAGAHDQRRGQAVDAERCGLGAVVGQHVDHVADIEGRFADAERRYTKAADGMRRSGSLHAPGFLGLALAATWANNGTLGEHLDEVRSLHEALGPIASDLLALALHANGLITEARRVRTSAPIRPDFFFTFLTTSRAMAVIALDDRAAAEELYATLLPHHDGPPAGATSLSVALRPVAHTLGELAVLLGRDHEAAAHFAQAATIADRWNALHWAAEARCRTTHLAFAHGAAPL
jgi:hypothetical protein